MSDENQHLHLPEFDAFTESVAFLTLHISPSELHGIMCGFLCANCDHQGETYLRTLINNKKDAESRNAFLSMASVFSISQQQINNFNFEFAMLLPDDNEPLIARAKAFSEWCEGFIQGLTMAGIDADQFYEEEAQDAFQHLKDFSELDYQSLDIDEEDEKALLEVSEYARMAVLRLHNDLMINKKESGQMDRHH